MIRKQIIFEYKSRYVDEVSFLEHMVYWFDGVNLMVSLGGVASSDELPKVIDITYFTNWSEFGEIRKQMESRQQLYDALGFLVSHGVIHLDKKKKLRGFINNFGRQSLHAQMETRDELNKLVKYGKLSHNAMNAAMQVSVLEHQTAIQTMKSATPPDQPWSDQQRAIRDMIWRFADPGIMSKTCLRLIERANFRDR